jgi:Flp pilus assembly protein TadB
MLGPSHPIPATLYFLGACTALGALVGAIPLVLLIAFTLAWIVHGIGWARRQEKEQRVTELILKDIRAQARAGTVHPVGPATTAD